MTEVKIYHLYHSGTAVEEGNKLYIFDYYKDKQNASSIKEIFSNFETKQEVYVFASHGHPDHFSGDIYDWEDYNDKLNYILSRDISYTRKQENIHLVSKNEAINPGSIRVKTLGSTDKGVSFLVKTDKLNIFHSGDLNWWHWESFSASELKQEEEDFKQEIDKLKGKKIDIAFVPVDPRLGESYYLAGEYFIQTIQPKILVPIHFGEKYSVVNKFQQHVKDFSVQIPDIDREKRLVSTFSLGDLNG